MSDKTKKDGNPDIHFPDPAHLHIPTPDDIADKVRDILSGSFNAVKTDINGVGKTVGSAVGSVASDVAKVPGDIGGLFKAADQAAIDQIGDLKTLLGKLPNPSHLASSVSGIVEADIISLTGSSNGFAETLTAFVNALKSALATILSAVGLGGKVQSALDDVVTLIDKVGDVVLAPLSVMSKYLDLSPEGELITKINAAAAHMSASAAPDTDTILVSDSAAKDMKIGALVLRLISTFVDWIKAAVPITVNLNGDAGGALGVLASLGASVQSVSLTNIILQPVSGLCNFGATALTTFAGFKD